MSTGPAWSGAFDRGALRHVVSLPFAEVREWAFGGSTGAGVKVAVIDSGVDADHPRVGGVAGGVAFELDADGGVRVRRERGPARRPGRPRHGLRRDHPVDRSGRGDLQRPGAGRQPQGPRCAAARRRRVERRARHARRQPVAVEQGRGDVRPAARGGRPGLLLRHRARLRGQQPARPDVPLAVRLGDLGGRPRGCRGARAGLQRPTRRSSSALAASTSTSRGPSTGRSPRPATASPRRT